MQLIRLTEAGQSRTKLGAFLEALMRGFKPEEFVMSTGRLHYNFVLFEREGKLTEQRKGEFVKHWNALKALCQEAGLVTTTNYISSVLANVLDGTNNNLQHMEEAVRNTRRVLYEEMRGLQYFEIPQRKVHYWTDKEPFGNAVATKIPDAVYEIEEASKCLALDRTTACVFHLMRALDFALAAFSSHIGSTVDPLKNWSPILDGIRDKIKLMPESTTQEKIKKEDYWRIHGHLSAVKNAWRNPTMHPRKHYNEEEAEDIFCATRGFIRDVTRVI